MSEPIEDIGNGWRRVMSTRVALMPRTGWRGAWDAFVAFVMRRPQRTVETDVTMSIYVKGDQPIKLELWGAQIEQSPHYGGRLGKP